MNFNIDLSSNAHLLSLGVGIFPTSARGSAYLADPCDGMRRDDEGRGGSCFTMVPACCAISLVVILHTGVELTATRPLDRAVGTPGSKAIFESSVDSTSRCSYDVQARRP